ncbi:hypothetical protein [Planomonospora sp. ID67723]|uniref:hypothetical protein n=1 Tax=Planomonospora sp. ID67723 TaxID=2738134 RepID=UPI001E391C4C|nr:hypothetical protein [Planomonospora sp. ID67723]
MATRLRWRDWIEVPVHQRGAPLWSRKKTLPTVLGRLTFLTLVETPLSPPTGATVPALLALVSPWPRTSLVTSLLSQVYWVAFFSAAPLASSQNAAIA